MKKNLIKKVFAVSLSIAMACSLVPAANTVTASAAAPYVSLKTTFKTLKIGQNYKMTLKNNTSSWKIKKVETTDKTIATVHSKTTSSVMIKGKSEGRATVRVKIKTAKRKTSNTKTLRCRVKVVKDSPSTDNPVVVQTDATVATQEELTAALADSNITKITIKTDAAVSFTIPDGTYSNVDLTVDAPNASVTNSATFKSITINSIKDETWTENGKNNTIAVNAEKARVVVGANAVVKGITIGKTNANVKLVVNGGAVNAVSVTAKATLDISGTSTAAIPVTVAASAADAEVTSAVPVAIETSAKITIKLESGSKGSSVKIALAGVSITITNRSGDTVEVSLPNGTVHKVANGQVGQSVTAPVTTTNPTYPGTSYPTTPGTSSNKLDAVDMIVTTPSAANIASAAISINNAVTSVSEVTSGSAIVTESALKASGTLRVTIGAHRMASKTGGAIEYRVVAEWGTNSRSTLLSWTDAKNIYRDGKYVEAEIAGTTKDVTLSNVEAGSIKVKIEYRIKEDASHAAGTIVPVAKTYTLTETQINTSKEATGDAKWVTLTAE